MASNAYSTPASVSQSSGVLLAWINITNLLLSDNSLATAALTLANNQSETLFCTSFANQVPASVMTGVEVEVENDTLDAQVTLSVSLTKNGTTAVGTPKTTTSTGIVTLGSSTDLWGAVLRETDVEASTFGVLVSAAYAGATVGTVAIDRIRLRINFAGILESVAYARPMGTM